MDIIEVKELINSDDIRMVDIRFFDIFGKMKHVTVSSSYFARAMEKGVGIDGSSIPGFASISNSDMRLKPDLSTAFMDPMHEGVLAVFGDVYLSSEEKIFDRYPRHVLKKALLYAREEKIADDFFALGELEFYLFKDIKFDDDFFILDYSEELHMEKGYHVAEPDDSLFELRNTVMEVLEELEIMVKYHHHEVGTRSQHEIELSFAPVLNMADYVEIAKYLIKEVARDFELYATFMPKPIYGEPGSGLHFHLYPFKNGVNLFSMRGGKLNSTARYFIGGILKHAKSLTAFTNPSTNSYKRLMSGFEAPFAINYSIANRSSAIRIPGYVDKKNIDIEYRPPDATMNTYFGLAAILMAGIDGIKNKMDPGNPVEANVYENMDSFERLPETLCKALDELEKDHEYLLKGEVFTEELINIWIALKRKEYREISLRPVPAEFRLYF